MASQSGLTGFNKSLENGHSSLFQCKLLPLLFATHIKGQPLFFFQFYFTLAPSLELWLSISNDFLEKKKLSGEMKSQQQNLHFYRSECVRTLSRAKNVLQLISLDALYIIEKFLMLRAAAEANFFATNSIRNLTTTDETGKSVNWKWKVKKHETQLQTERSSNPNGFD